MRPEGIAGSGLVVWETRPSLAILREEANSRGDGHERAGTRTRGREP
jgi:hypothetical protein